MTSDDDQEHYERQLEIASSYIKELQAEKKRLTALLPRVFQMAQEQDDDRDEVGFNYDTLGEVLKAIEKEGKK